MVKPVMPRDLGGEEGELFGGIGWVRGHGQSLGTAARRIKLKRAAPAASLMARQGPR
jgi:hypothetical protein